MYFWLLPKLYYCHGGLVKNLIKKPNKKDLVKMVKSKLICPKWHFGQVGHGGKKTIWGFVLSKFLVKKVRFSYSDELLGLGLLLHLSHPNLQLPKNIRDKEMKIWMGGKGGGGVTKKKGGRLTKGILIKYNRSK
jgi:hypothetical protein